MAVAKRPLRLCNMHLPIPNNDPNFHMDELSYFTNQHIHERNGISPLNRSSFPDAFPPKNPKETHLTLG